MHYASACVLKLSLRSQVLWSPRKQRNRGNVARLEESACLKRNQKYVFFHCFGVKLSTVLLFVLAWRFPAQYLYYIGSVLLLASRIKHSIVYRCSIIPSLHITVLVIPFSVFAQENVWRKSLFLNSTCAFATFWHDFVSYFKHIVFSFHLPRIHFFLHSSYASLYGVW